MRHGLSGGVALLRHLKAHDPQFPLSSILRKESHAQSLPIFSAKQKLAGHCWLFFVCLFFQLVHLVSAAEIIREKEAELSGFLPGSAGWPDSTQGKGLLTDGRV